MYTYNLDISLVMCCIVPMWITISIIHSYMIVLFKCCYFITLEIINNRQTTKLMTLNKHQRSYRNRKGQYITEEQQRSIDRVPLVISAIVFTLAFVSYGAVELQAKVQEWNTETMNAQDALYAPSGIADVEATAVRVVEIENDTCNLTKTDIAMWYMDNQDKLIHAEGIDNYERILNDGNQYTRDIIYCDELINNQ